MTAKQSPLFDPKLFLSKAGAGKTIAAYPKNRVVFSQGGRADAIFYIQRGNVKLTVVSNAGKEAVVGILGAGDFLGEGCLTAQPLRMTKANAVSQCSIVRLEKAAMIRVLHHEPAFSGMFLAYLLSRNMRMGRPWSISSPAPVRRGWRACFFCWPTSAAKPTSTGLGFLEYNGKLHIHNSLLNIVLHD